MTRATTSRFCSPISVHVLDLSTSLTYESSGTALVQSFLVLLLGGLSFSLFFILSCLCLLVLVHLQETLCPGSLFCANRLCSS